MSICCQQLPAICPAPSPFLEKLVLNWYDGPLEGIVRCAECQREYYFNDLAADEEAGVRLYGLFHVPAGTLERVKQILPKRHPIWEFNSDSAKRDAEKVIHKLKDDASELSWVVASKDFKEILACRSGAELESRDGVDWSHFLLELTTPVR